MVSVLPLEMPFSETHWTLERREKKGKHIREFSDGPIFVRLLHVPCATQSS
jgi:hypothetical protein